MSIEYIRNTYGVPAKRGGRVMVKLDGANVGGTITGTRGPYLRIRLDGRKKSGLYHPTDHLDYACKSDGGQCGTGGYCTNCHNKKTPNAKSQATDAALSRQVACTDGLATGGKNEAT